MQNLPSYIPKFEQAGLILIAYLPDLNARVRNTAILLLENVLLALKCFFLGYRVYLNGPSFLADPNMVGRLLRLISVLFSEK